MKKLIVLLLLLLVGCGSLSFRTHEFNSESGAKQMKFTLHTDDEVNFRFCPDMDEGTASARLASSVMELHNFEASEDCNTWETIITNETMGNYTFHVEFFGTGKAALHYSIK